MLGRAAYQDPWLLAELQNSVFGRGAPAKRVDAIAALSDYLRRQVAAGVPAAHVTRHVLGLFRGRPGGRIWRRYLSEHAHREPGNADLLEDALAAMAARGENGSAGVHTDRLE